MTLLRMFKKPTGFTLIEVTLATGLVAFSVLTLVGIMGVGTTTLAGAVDNTVHAEITQNILGSLQQSDFTMITGTSSTDWNGRVIYFDERGISVTAKSKAIYVATTSIQVPVTLPGSTTANANLAEASVAIVKNGNASTAFKIATIVANNGK